MLALASIPLRLVLILFGRGWAAVVVAGCSLSVAKGALLPPSPPVSGLALVGVATLWALVPMCDGDSNRGVPASRPSASVCPLH